MKVAYLKNLQGYLWENGYKTGAYATPLFPDVAPRLKQWRNDGLELAIYSSGSVFAQKLLFAHVKTEVTVTGQKRSRPDEIDEDVSAGSADEPLAKKRATGAEGEGAQKSELQAVCALESDKPVNGYVTANVASRKDKTTTEGSDHATTDLQYLISSWFDTTNAGLKSEQGSYEKIATTLEVCFDGILHHCTGCIRSSRDAKADLL